MDCPLLDQLLAREAKAFECTQLAVLQSWIPAYAFGVVGAALANTIWDVVLCSDSNGLNSTSQDDL